LSLVVVLVLMEIVLGGVPVVVALVDLSIVQHTL
jgi:hypothetical protein